MRVDWFVRAIWKPMLKGAADHLAIAELRNNPFHLKVPKARTFYDGDPEQVDWEQARDIGGLVSFVGIPNTVPREIRVKTIHDGKWMYVQLSDNVDPTQLDSGTPFGAKTFTDPLFFDSFVFTVAPKDQLLYRSVNVYGPGDGWTSVIGSGDTNDIWKRGWKGISNKTKPQHWRAWAVVALEDLIPGGARSGTTFRGNFYRYCHVPQGGLLVWRPHFSMELHRDIKYMGTITLD